jgi:predicted AlkP superfamily phosphohydrolase/phosphomutase
MLTIKNIRPGILVIPDAGLKLNPGQVVEIEESTRQIEWALKKGYLALIDNHRSDAPNGSQKAFKESDAIDLGKLTAVEAISRIDAEADPETLKGHLETEKRRTVIDALKSRLEELQGAGQ